MLVFLFDHFVIYIYIHQGPTIEDPSIISSVHAIVPLANVGRESHTYLTHIVDHYDDLSEVTIFLPGSCTDEHTGKIVKTNNVLSNTMRTMSSVFWGQYSADMLRIKAEFQIDVWAGSNSSNAANNPSIACLPADPRPFGRYRK